MSKLYVVGTPIGNLGDMTPRATQTLQSVDVIAAEDTRVSRGLLTHFNISTPMISYHQHNEKERGAEIVRRILDGQSVAIITDAGMPAISDPGEQVVQQCAKAGIEVVVIPGPTAALSALAISGQSTRRFLFEGFLSGKDEDKRNQLLEVRDLPHTLIYYESPHHLVATLAVMTEVLGNREISLCRELTKMYEEVRRTTLEDALAYYKEETPRGEFVLVIAGAPPTTEEEITFEQAVELVLQRYEKGAPLSQSAREVANLTGFGRSKLYKQALKNQ